MSSNVVRTYSTNTLLHLEAWLGVGICRKHLMQGRLFPLAFTLLLAFADFEEIHPTVNSYLCADVMLVLITYWRIHCCFTVFRLRDFSTQVTAFAVVNFEFYSRIFRWCSIYSILK